MWLLSQEYIDLDLYLVVMTAVVIADARRIQQPCVLDQTAEDAKDAGQVINDTHSPFGG